MKICGLMDGETIALMDGLPLHEIGLVFAPSRRQVNKELAAQLVQAIHSLKNEDGNRPKAAGVFVNASLAEISEVLSVVPLDIAQLHGDETPAYCEELRHRHPDLSIWRVFSIKSGVTAEDAFQSSDEAEKRLSPFAGKVDALLIDAPGGGTGQPFNWSQIEAYKEAAGAVHLPLYVAGGLHPDNVQQLLRKHAPSGIDVSSGVETDGSKDIEKIRLFLRRVMEA